MAALVAPGAVRDEVCEAVFALADRDVRSRELAV